MGRFSKLLTDSPGGAKKARKAKPTKKAAPVAAAEDPPAQAASKPRPRGRPRGSGKGKRSSKDFVQAGAYVRRDTLRDVKIELMRDGGRQDFSDLVETLLAGWLSGRK